MKTYIHILRHKYSEQDFPGGPVVKNPLPVLGTQVPSLVQEDIMCQGTTKPVYHNYWACVPRACPPQQEKPPQWEVCAAKLESSPCPLQLEKAWVQ